MTQKEASFIKQAMENDGEEAEIIMDYKPFKRNKTIAVKVGHIGLLIPALVEECKANARNGFIKDIPDFNTLGKDEWGQSLILF